MNLQYKFAIIRDKQKCLGKCPYGYLFITLTTISNNNPKKIFPQYYMHSDVRNRFQSLKTH